MKHDTSILAATVAAILLAAAPSAMSQSASATLRGQVLAGEQAVPCGDCDCKQRSHRLFAPGPDG